MPDQQTTDTADKRDMSAKTTDAEPKTGIVHQDDMTKAEGILSQERMQAKTSDFGSGLHPVSSSVGKVVSDHETDGEGKGPEDIAQMKEAQPTAPTDATVKTTDTSSKTADKSYKSSETSSSKSSDK